MARRHILAILSGALVGACGLALTGTGTHGSDLGADASQDRSTAEEGAVDPADAPTATGDAPSDAGPFLADAGDGGITLDADAARADDARASDTGVDSGPSLLFACGASTVTDCALCVPAPNIPCVFCTATGLVGVCLGDPKNSSCSDVLPADASACPCGGGVSQCVTDTQVCLSGECTTCGEKESDGLTCKAGGSCKRNGRKCE